ncbi:alpha amylase family protein [Chitinophaga alhagiae]|uniref:alpha amylase family protein n=1 Tax=Chitinophaga alhagiae TaxID=2203219 RepID=UPI0018E56C58|nr:alpha amylase family protein [Chitinophaga alhagiae]
MHTVKMITGLLLMAAGWQTAAAQHPRKNILWFDATANFQRFGQKDSIVYYLQRSKDAGITDVVVDVKPITGEVLYPSRIAPVMTEWEGKTRDVSWDMLGYFLQESHRLGMKVHASANVFVAGHNFFDRGVVYEDAFKKSWQTISYLPETGMTPITQQKKKYSAMLNPANREVQRYELSILKELVGKYPQLDGIILDRVRYDALATDFSAVSRKAFERHLKRKVARFPEDIMSYSGKQVVKGPLFNQWIEWRAKVVHDFIYEARAAIKKINPAISFGDYTGSWYPTYYELGVNWASKEYDPATEFAWATPGYKKYAYAEALDLFTTGNYYFEVDKAEKNKIDTASVNRTEAAQTRAAEEWYTVEGSAELVNRLTLGKIPVYAGLYVEQYKGHPGQFVRALKMCRQKSDGAMVFDIVHIINYGWWRELKEGLTD